MFRFSHNRIIRKNYFSSDVFSSYKEKALESIIAVKAAAGPIYAFANGTYTLTQPSQKERIIYSSKIIRDSVLKNNECPRTK